VEFETSIEIDAPREQVWATMVAVEEWPDWNPTTTSVERLGGPLAPDAEVRIKQPRLPTAVWKVTAFDPGTSFVWRSARPGVTTVGTHVISAGEGDRVKVTLGIHQSGAIAPVLGLFVSGLARRYVQMEAASLKQRCEGDSTPA
jgi:uncharacterized membrane protein